MDSKWFAQNNNGLSSNGLSTIFKALYVSCKRSFNVHMCIKKELQIWHIHSPWCLIFWCLENSPAKNSSLSNSLLLNSPTKYSLKENSTVEDSPVSFSQIIFSDNLFPLKLSSTGNFKLFQAGRSEHSHKTSSF